MSPVSVRRLLVAGVLGAVVALTGASPARAVDAGLSSAPVQDFSRVTFELPNALPAARCKTNAAITQDHSCWGELLLRFTVQGLASNQDVYSALTAHYTETFGCADTRTGALDPARRRVLTGWGRAADPQPLPRPTADDGTVAGDGGISLHSPNPDGNTAPDGRTRINAPFNCREGQTVVRLKVVLDHVVAHLRVLDRAPGNAAEVVLAVPGTFTSTAADYRHVRLP